MKIERNGEKITLKYHEIVEAFTEHIRENILPSVCREWLDGVIDTDDDRYNVPIIISEICDYAYDLIYHRDDFNLSEDHIRDIFDEIAEDYFYDEIHR